MLNRTKNSAVLGLLTALLCLLFVGEGVADDLHSPQEIIQSVSEKIQTKLKDKVFTKNFAQVTQFVNEVIEPYTDFDKIAPLVLGKHWKTATSEEQGRFKHEFQTLIVRAYSRAFVEYQDWKINFLPLEKLNDPAKVIVKTKVLQPNILPVDVYYRMYLSQDGWKVYDIIIDGVSLVTNYRSTFNDEIQRQGSLKAVIDMLAKRNAEALQPKGA